MASTKETSAIAIIAPRQKSVFECFKSVLFMGRTISLGEVDASLGPSVVASEALQPPPRVLFPGDVFFDERVQSSLNILQAQLSEPDAPPPLVEESCSSSSSSLSSDEAWDDDENDHLKCQEFKVQHGHSRFVNKDQVRSAKRSLQHVGNSNSLALTLMGSKGVNQDSGMVVYPLVPNQEGPTMLLGVMDGHGDQGEVVSGYCQAELERRISLSMKLLLKTTPVKDINPKTTARLLQKIVQDVDDCIPKELAEHGGTTASLVLQLDQTVFLVNTGDSQSLIVAYIPSTGECMTLESTVRHSPELFAERQRVEAAGASISEDGYIVYDKNDEEYHFIAMSRSLGDRCAPGVIATPQVTYSSLSDLKERALRQSLARGKLAPEDVELLALSVSDGVLDVASLPEEIAPGLARAFFVPEARHHPLAAADDAIQFCAGRWHKAFAGTGSYRDDITICAAKLTARA